MSTLSEYVVAGDPASAVELALEHRTEWVRSEIDYSTEWAAGEFLLPLVHLEHSSAIGARLYLAYAEQLDDMCFIAREGTNRGSST